MANIMELSEIHRHQLQRFTQFFKGKKDKALSDRDADYTDFVSDRLSDPAAIFSNADVEALVGHFHATMKQQVAEVLETHVNLSAVYVAQLLSQAEMSGVALQVEDISCIEDQTRLQQISALSALQSAPPPVPKPRAALPTLSAQAQSDPAVVQEMNELREQNRQLEERFKAMQTEVSTLCQERGQMTAQLDQANQLVLHMKASYGVDTSHVEQSLAIAKASLDQRTGELEQMRHELNQRLADSSQFKDLKAIVQKKNEDIKNLKAIMMQYGIQPPATEGDCIELTADDD